MSLQALAGSSVSLSTIHAPKEPNFAHVRNVAHADGWVCWLSPENIDNPEQDIADGYLPEWMLSLCLALKNAGAQGTVVVCFDWEAGGYNNVEKFA